ncbi:TerB family tellurite resistance protein [soil metagenome]
MLVIFGFRIRYRTTGRIEFFCPRCGGDRTGLQRSARRWFTIFWIPVIPLNSVGELVECTECHTRYEPDVTDQPTTASLTETFANAVRVLTAMIVRTGEPFDPTMRTAAVTAIRGVTSGYDDATLTSDVLAVDPAYAEQYVAPLAHGLEISGKERLVADLVRVALAGNTLTTDQRRVVDLAGRGLDLTPAHVTGIVTSVASASSNEPGSPPADDAAPST